MCNEMNDLPLKCRIDTESDKIIMEVGANVLRFVTENAPHLHPDIRVTDIDAFMQEIVNTINEEEEDGTTLLVVFMDNVIKRAIESGAEGVEMIESID